ncbi:RHS repeat-associated core domain-containing protein [Variovorax sp. E3]|uniref:RHS repeat-associated core domain-containing protein n=1 Tax=Variovorax sp. E3 TaxID=1914993 RepID=UPI0018DD5CE0|nr:RHS repeat-associated core domain-containing protein [Variovorax sp. E3]
MQSLIAFFTKLWSPSTTQAEQLGYAYVYDEQGTLIAEVGSGGTASGGQAQYIYLPTANGPMPIAAVIDGATYAVHSDHLNTPRKLTNASEQAVWQWSYSAFGEDKPTVAKNRFANLEVTPNSGTTGISEVKFNLRYPGQYADEESGLFYNGFRTYDPRVGRYTQSDPIGLDGGWNRFSYVDANPMSFVDPEGLAGGPPRSTPRVPLPGGGAVSNGLLSGIAEAMRGSQAGAAGAGARALAGAGSGRGTINPPLPDSAYVCRGGLCTADRFAGGSGVTIDSAGKMCRASVNSAAGKSVQELSTGIPNPKMGVTTVGDVRRLGGDVVPDPTPKNPDHCLMCGITPAQAERLFAPVVPNPNR